MPRKRQPKVTERFTFTNLGYLVAGKASRAGGDIPHYDKKYEVATDTISKDGVRTIVLNPCDMKEVAQKKEQVIGAITEALGEKGSKTFRAILEDTLNDQWDETIELFHDKIFKKKQKISAREGCFKIYIGDGRESRSTEIMIRN